MLAAELEKLGVHDYTIQCFTSMYEFMAVWQAGAFSLIFLDIFIGTDSGVDIARRIRDSDHFVSIIFVTTSNEFAAQSYEVDAAYYLHKPLDRFKIASMLRRINLEQLGRKRFLELPGGERLRLTEIMYTDKFSHSVTFHLVGNCKKVIRITHNAVERFLLPHAEFCTVGQGTIINFDYVESLTAQGFVMKNQHLIPVPRRRYKELKGAFLKYSFERAVKEDFF